MFWKRQVPLGIVFIVGIFTLFGWFIDQATIESFINDDATQWYDIIASFAVILGALNLLKIHMLKVYKKHPNTPYSLIAIGGFFFAIFAGFIMKGAYQVEVNNVGSDPTAVSEVLLTDDLEAINLEAVAEDTPQVVDRTFKTRAGANALVDRINTAGGSAALVDIPWGAHLQTQGSLFHWMFMQIFTPLLASMFALLAFFVASASYRAFRIRNFEATLLLAAGIILMLGRVPIGSLISAWFVAYLLVLGIGVLVSSLVRNRIITLAVVGGGILIVTIAGFAAGWPVDRPAFLFLPDLQDWIYNFPNAAGARAIMIGIALGMVGTSLRVILGIEKSFMGE